MFFDINTICPLCGSKVGKIKIELYADGTIRSISGKCGCGSKLVARNIYKKEERIANYIRNIHVPPTKTTVSVLTKTAIDNWNEILKVEEKTDG